ncbi:MAG: hypothetical protein R3C49_04835 [Planctomycetaceae bacterium]
MKPNADKQLDQLLSQWADECDSAERLAGLHNRIVQSLTEPAPKESTALVDSAGPVPTIVSQQRRPWASHVAVAVAVVALLSVSLKMWNSDSVNPISPGRDVPPEYAWLRGEQIQRQSVLFQELDQMFGREIAWVAETGEQLKLGMDESLSDVAESLRSEPVRDRVAVRIVVEQKPSGTRDWRTAWVVDVAARSEELVQFDDPQADHSTLQLWVYRLPDGAIVVDTDLQLRGLTSLSARTSEMHRSAKPVSIRTGTHDNTEFRIFQSATNLKNEVI